MGLFDKLKNVFFEEEEVEDVDEERVEPREKVPVAKKIDIQEVKKKEEIKENKIEKMDDFSNTLEFQNKEPKTIEKDFKFPMGFDDKDFEVEKTIEIFGPIKEKEEVEPVVEEVKEEVVSDEPPMAEPVVEEEYHYEEVRYKEPEEVHVEETRENYHKLYEGREKDKEEKSRFTPSPIISPIVGVLNQNYKKEEIVTRDERKKAEVVTKKDSVDMVLEKAYGDLAGEISASIDDDVIDINKEEPKEKEDLLYDLNEEESPTVKTVTVGDAEEYFNDLGLEYNVDYKIEKEEEKKEEEPVRPKRVEKLDIDDSNKDDDKNLFDLIDAMYEDEEKE